MMIAQILLTVLLLGWLFFRAAAEDEERQQLLELAADRGLELSEQRACASVCSALPASRSLIWTG